MSSDDPTSEPSPSEPPKKSVLTHTAPRKAGSASDKDIADRPLPAAAVPQKDPPKSPGKSPPALSEKMAAISSLRDSTVGEEGRNPTGWRDRAKMLSSLPDALSRVDRRLRFDTELNPTNTESAGEEEFVQVEDPAPGSFSVIWWFLFRFGRFVHGPMLRQSRFVLFGILILLSLSFCAQMIQWTNPSLTTADSFFISSGFFLRLGLSLGIGLGFYLGLSWLFVTSLGQGETKISPLFGLRIVVNAFLPLGIVQSSYLLVHNAWLGEAFWRGATLDFSSGWAGWGFPLAWAWSGYRLSQATCALIPLSFTRTLQTKVGLIALMSAIAVSLHPAFVGWTKQDAMQNWSMERERMLDPGNEFEPTRLAALEKALPLEAVDARTDLYLYRLQQRFRQGDMEVALEDAYRLQKMSPEGTAEDDLAKGLILFLKGRLDLAVNRWNAAVRKDPDLLPAHQWLALAAVGSNVEEAERHARQLMKIDPNVFHLYLVVRILSAQEKDAAIWEAMFQVDAPPEDWYPLTLVQGGLAARNLGKIKRSERLLTLAEAKGMSAEPPVDSAVE